jgi:L-iditol 2-dehydrogenase
MTGTMRAAVLHGKEDVRIEQVPVPHLEPGDVLLKTEVALTCGTDVKVFRRGYHARMITPPALFGHEVAGIVAEVGPGPHAIERGASVVAANSAPCGECEYCRRGRETLCDNLQFWNGAYAEFVRIPARIARRNLLRLPEGVGFREGALTEPLACVVRGIEATQVASGDTVAVIGVGPVGLMLAALARRRGARVVAVGRRPERLLAARDMGATVTVAVGPGEDLVQVLRRESPDGLGPHVIFEAAGAVETADAAIQGVRKGGTVNLFAGCPAGTRVPVDAQRLHYDEITLTSSFHHTPAAMREALRLIAARAIDASALVTSDADLEALPDVLRGTIGGNGLKTAIRPWAPSRGD